MRFEQSSDILKHQVAGYHRALSTLYREFAVREPAPRIRLMLDYLIDHELRLALAIHDFMAEAPETALDYWFRRIEIPFPEPDPATLTDGCLLDLDLLVGASIQYKSQLIAFYDHLVQQCDSPESAALFQALKTQEEKGMKRFIRHAQGLADL